MSAGMLRVRLGNFELCMCSLVSTRQSGRGLARLGVLNVVKVIFWVPGKAIYV